MHRKYGIAFTSSVYIDVQKILLCTFTFCIHQFLI